MNSRAKRDRALIKPILALNALVLCAGTLSSCGDIPEKVLNPPVTTVTIGPAPEETTTPEPVPEPEPEPTTSEVAEAKKNPAWNDGMYQVGDDIKPGRYRTTNVDNNMCYYARLSGDSGELGDIISNNLADGPMSVTVNRTDAFIEFNGGCEWKRAPGGN